MTVSLEALMAAAAPAVNDAGMSLPTGTIRFRERQDADGFYWVLSTDSGALAEMRVPEVVHVRTAVVALAAIVQQAVAQTLDGAGRSRRWPTCTAHRVDHSLRPDVIDREASWVCPATGEAVARIGGLVDLEAFARRHASELAADMAWFLRYQGLEVDEAKRLAAAEGRPVRILGPTGGRPNLDRTRLNIRLGPDGELVGMEPG